MRAEPILSAWEHLLVGGAVALSRVPACTVVRAGARGRASAQAPCVLLTIRSMEAAVRALVGGQGRPRHVSRWRGPQMVGAIPPPWPTPVPHRTRCTFKPPWLTASMSSSIRQFPAYAPPLRTVLGFQVNHVDVEFYDRFYRPEALSKSQREHLHGWHGRVKETRVVRRLARAISRMQL